MVNRERLAFHRYVVSDIPLCFQLFDNPLLVSDKNRFPLTAITVIEIKRPMRNDRPEGKDNNPLDQALEYLERIREGKVKTKSGRRIPKSHDIPGYCYVICELTEWMKRKCRHANLRATSNRMRYFGYNETYCAYIQVSSFDQWVKATKERHRAWCEPAPYDCTTRTLCQTELPAL